MKPKAEPAIILSSGGLDSTTCVAVAAFLLCRNRLMMLKEAGGDENEYGSGPVDFSASLRPDAPPTRKRRRPNRWAIRRLRRQAKRDAAEQQTIDDILAKVSARGMQALTWAERRALKRATDRQRQRDVELSRND